MTAFCDTLPKANRAVRHGPLSCIFQAITENLVAYVGARPCGGFGYASVGTVEIVDE
jgi:hypothetical protein